MTMRGSVTPEHPAALVATSARGSKPQAVESRKSKRASIGNKPGRRRRRCTREFVRRYNGAKQNFYAYVRPWMVPSGSDVAFRCR